MIEFVEKEVWCIEESEVSRSSLLSFFLNGHRKELVVLQNKGVFRKYLTYEILLYNTSEPDYSVTIGENIFQEAGKFFADKENRIKLLPVVNCDGQLISFMRWNNQKKEGQRPDQNQSEIEQAAKIFIRECSESIYQWLQNFLKEYSGKEIILKGEGWEVLSASKMIPVNKNKISLDTRRGCGALELTFEQDPRIKVNTVKPMYQLKDAYHAYRIFVWLENKTGVDLFTRLAFSGIRIEGFCNNQSEQLKDFLGKTVMDAESVIKDADVLIVYESQDKIEEIREEYSEIRALCIIYQRLFELRGEVREKKNIILYDSWKKAEELVEILEKDDVEVSGYSAIAGVSTKYGEKNVDMNQLIEDAENYNIILASATHCFENSLQGLKNRNRDILVPSSDIMYCASGVMLEGNVGWYLDKPIREQKKIILYGAESCFTNAWLFFFHNIGIAIEKILDDAAQKEEGIGSIFDLAYENPMDTYVVINKKLSEYVKSYGVVEDFGFDHFNENYTGLYPVGQCFLPVKEDVTVGYVMETLLENGKYPGFRAYGEEKQDDFRIVILGGSTTTADMFRATCWPQMLYDRFVEEEKHVAVYNGGVAGYSAGEELFKLIRDVGQLKPDLVISFSGLNNRKKKEFPYVPWYMESIFKGLYRDDFCKGIKNENMSAAQIWVQQEQMMQAICETVYGIKFVCFVQPVYASKKKMSSIERLKFEEDIELRKSALEFRKEASQMAKQYKWMIDIQNLLDAKPEVFMDCVHVYEEGNRIITDAVYEWVKGLLP